MKIFLYKLIKNHIFWASAVLIIIDVTAYYLFLINKDKENVLAAVTTGSVVVFGYFATNYLTILRDQRQKKLEQYLDLIKKIRFFILEEHIKGTDKQKKLRDEFQDAYLAFSLLTSAKSYNALSAMMDKLKILLEDNQTENNQKKRCDFEEAQKKFINGLRNEFFIDKEINFKTYDFRLSQEKKEK